MLIAEDINMFVVIFLTIIIVVCSISIVIAIKFQNKQKKKYEECLKLIAEKENGILDNNNGPDDDEVRKIIGNVDVNEFMDNLYNLYLEFIDRLNKNDNFDGVLDNFIKELYENKINIYKAKGFNEITQNIDLINYSILELDNVKLKFRINITCFSYKTKYEKLISGSNLERVEQILLVTYINLNGEWLINNIEKVYEKNLSM